MTLIRLPKRSLPAAACVLMLAGLSPAVAQFLPSPVQGNSSGVFPPPPGQNSAPRQDPAFPPPPGQNSSPRQDGAFPPPPGQAGAPRQGSAFPPPQGSSARPAVAGQDAGPDAFANPAQRVCLEFPAMRDDVGKAFSQIRAGSARKITREEACPLFKVAVAKEEKMLKFLETNKALCGVPQQIITQVKTNHVQTVRVRDNICSNRPTGPAGPSLSDALGAPVIADDSEAKKPGRGTFDTLTGNVLSR
jgi:hypothetical protein